MTQCSWDCELWLFWEGHIITTLWVGFDGDGVYCYRCHTDLILSINWEIIIDEEVDDVDVSLPRSPGQSTVPSLKHQQHH